MRALLDTNIIIDVATKRAPWEAESIQVLDANANKRVVACLSASTVTDIFYICRKLAGLQNAFDTVGFCLKNLQLCSVTKIELERALEFQGRDFEDNLQIACAEANQIELIVTRDKDGFKNSPIEVLTPGELLARLNVPPKTP